MFDHDIELSFVIVDEVPIVSSRLSQDLSRGLSMAEAESGL